MNTIQRISDLGKHELEATYLTPYLLYRVWDMRLGHLGVGKAGETEVWSRRSKREVEHSYWEITLDHKNRPAVKVHFQWKKVRGMWVFVSDSSSMSRQSTDQSQDWKARGLQHSRRWNMAVYRLIMMSEWWLWFANVDQTVRVSVMHRDNNSG